MHYRRAPAPGGTFFFTVNLHDRHGDLLTRHIHALREAVRQVKARHPFTIVAWVVLPEHMHAVWALPTDDADFATRWALIKANFSRAIGQGEPVSASRRRKGERGIWQRRFWEHQIRDQRDLAHHVDYAHINPVKHGHVPRAADWPFSSIHRYIGQGAFGADWACEMDSTAGRGER